LSLFAFLQDEWPALHEAANRAASAVNADARSSCFYARRALELAVHWLYKHDAALKLPYQDHLSALIHAPSFRNLVGSAVFAKIKLIKDLGNLAVHSHKPMRQFDALAANKELFHVLFWLARTYARGKKPADGLAFDEKALPEGGGERQTREQLQRLETQLRERDEKLAHLLSGKKALDDELKKLRTEVAAIKRKNTRRADKHDYSETETRDYFIDLLLKEAGWALDRTQDREFPVTGMPNSKSEGFVDYVLWGDDGKPLGLVEAKRTKRDPRVGQQQAKLYADCLERQFGRRPVIFYSNGYDHWVWDDANYPPRAVQGFYKKDELELLIQRRGSRKKLADAKIDGKIVERYYQTRAIRRVSEAFERDGDRKALLVMATGSGKTRMAIALCELLMRCNWIKRVLFLADRVALVKQAVNAFKAHLPDAPPVNLVTEKDQDGRVFVSTYPTMMNLIEDSRDGQRRFGSGHFDLVIIDEAHRSIYQKYGAIFDYFDSLLVGLTATPKDEIDRNTYSLFDLENGVPTDAYDLEQAVKDGYLVPPKAVSVPLRFQREGISYDELSDEEKEAWDAIEWDDENGTPQRVEPEAVNRWLFNKDTVDKVLEHLMTHGLRVAGGDRLGKTIIFAKNHDHAQFIAERFDANYPHLKGRFARVIDFQTEYAQSLIDDFSIAAKAPHIAISVDMLDTGIDVIEVVNLVFFKLVRSKTKFWQMIGRGTRLCPDLFGPGRDKEFFYVFDYCQNLEFFSQDLPHTEGAGGESISKRLFKARLELISDLDKADGTSQLIDGDGQSGDPMASYTGRLSGTELRQATAELLRYEVCAMNVNNFVVRPKRRLVEKYSSEDSWRVLSNGDVAELANEIAGLPAEIEAEDEEAKRFDLLILRLQLALMRQEPQFTRLQEQVTAIAGLLQDQSSIPMIQAEMTLILELQTEEWWEDVTVTMLENARKRIRSLVKLIERQKRKPIYTDFEDEVGSERQVELSGFGARDDFARFKAKTREFLKAHENHIVIHKLRVNQPLTRTDIQELERMLSDSGLGSEDDVKRAGKESQGLGLFVRSLIGLDREAAKEAFGKFLVDKTMRANQIEFVDMIIDHLTEHGALDARLLYDSPFTDLNPKGVEGLFQSRHVDEIISILDKVRQRAVA
jgi:type I restriction enzyme R subunit